MLKSVIYPDMRYKEGVLEMKIGIGFEAPRGFRGKRNRARTRRSVLFSF
jgi:hypothetical protein